MRDPRDHNSYGVRPKYEVGDEVKVWPVYKRPIGVVKSIVDPGSFPIKYSVQYTYEDGTVFTEIFESSDLTLHRKFASSYRNDCDCGSKSSTGHSSWCAIEVNKFPKY